MASILTGLGFIPSAVTRWHKYSNSGFRNSHFVGSNFSPSFCICCRTIFKFLLCSLMVSPKMTISSMWTKQFILINLRNTWSIIRWNVPLAFFNPKGICFYSKWPWEVEKAVYFLQSSFIGIWLKSANISDAEKNFDFLILSRMSSIIGKGYASWSVSWFHFQESISIRNLLPFFGTIQSGELRDGLECLIIPFWSNFFVSYKENSLCFSDSFCDLKFIISPKLSMISCSVKLLQGKGPDESVNTSWYRHITFKMFSLICGSK